MTFIKRGIKKISNTLESGVSMVGSKAQVFHGTAVKTAGGLLKGDLFKDSKDGKIKSKKASAAAKRSSNLGAFKAKKGSKGFQKSPKKGSVEYNNNL